MDPARGKGKGGLPAVRAASLLWAGAPLLVVAAAALPLALVSRELVPYKERAPEGAQYVSGRDFTRVASFGFDRAAADVLWIRAIQYFDRQTWKPHDPIQRKSPLLAPMLDNVVALDPHFHGAYALGSLFLRIHRRYDEALDLLENGLEHNPGLFLYPSEMGHICAFDLGDRPVTDPKRIGPDIHSHRDLALKYYRIALECPDAPPFFARYYASVMTGRGRFEALLELWNDQYQKAGNHEELRKRALTLIRRTLAQRTTARLREALRRHREEHGALPAPGALPALPGLEDMRLAPLAPVRGIHAFRAGPFASGPVEGFLDGVLYDPGRGSVASLDRILDADADAREKIRAAVQGFMAQHGRMPAAGAAGFEELLSGRFLVRPPSHPLGGSYVLDANREPVPVEGWDEALAPLRGAVGR